MTIESKIAQLIVRRLRNEISVQERSELQAWLDADPANQAFMDGLSYPDLVKDSMTILLHKDEKRLDRKIDQVLELARTDAQTPAQPRIRILYRPPKQAILRLSDGKILPLKEIRVGGSIVRDGWRCNRCCHGTAWKESFFMGKWIRSKKDCWAVGMPQQTSHCRISYE